MAQPEPLHLTWRLTVRTDGSERARALTRALEPESEGHADLAVEEDQVVATGRGDVGTTLHTLDDLLACLDAAEGSLDATGDR